MHLTASPVDPVRIRTLVDDTSRRRHAWRDAALCVGETDDYFPEHDDDRPSPTALSRCAACPVAAECLAAALAAELTEPDRYGWWGGHGPADRARIAAELGFVTVPVDVDELADPAALARRLRADQRTIAQIADELRCTKRTVYRYLAATPAAA